MAIWLRPCLVISDFFSEASMLLLNKLDSLLFPFPRSSINVTRSISAISNATLSVRTIRSLSSLAW